METSTWDMGIDSFNAICELGIGDVINEVWSLYFMEWALVF